MPGIPAQVMILCIWCGGRNPLQGSRSMCLTLLTLKSFEQIRDFCCLIVVLCCCFMIDFGWNKVWNKGRVKEWKEYLDILQIEESKHKDFAEFIGRIFMFHAAAQPVRCSSHFLQKNGLAASDVPGGWRLFTQKHPSFVSFSHEWVFVFGVFSTWRASKIHDESLYKIIFKGFCWPQV